MSPNIFKWKVMLGIYVLYIIRKLKSPFVGEIFALALFMSVLSFFISLPHVMSNMMATRGSYDFFTTAFSKTQTTVKLITLAVLAALVLFVRNLTLSTTGLIRNRWA